MSNRKFEIGFVDGNMGKRREENILKVILGQEKNEVNEVEVIMVRRERMNIKRFWDNQKEEDEESKGTEL